MAAVSEDRVRDLLRTAVLDGLELRFPERLDRPEYVAIDRVLTMLGGRWNRKAGAHLFHDDPTGKLTAIRDGGPLPRPAKTAEGYVATPRELAVTLVREHTGIEDAEDDLVVLEPSAGDGALVRAILEAHPTVRVVAVEPNAERAARIVRNERVEVHVSTFEDFCARDRGLFDLVVMNPPFAIDGNATVWIDHVALAWSRLAPGGKVVSVAPRGYVFRDDKRHTQMRAVISEAGGNHVELPDDAFVESGTTVRTVVLWADKPPRPVTLPEPEPEPERRKRGKSKYTDAERDAVRQADKAHRDRANELLDDEQAVQQMTRTIHRTVGDGSHLASYSPRNQALIWTQAHERDMELVGDVGSVQWWAERGRMVRGGERGLRIIAPLGTETREKKETERKPGQPEPEGEERMRFRMISVFAGGQTVSAFEDLDDGDEGQVAS